MRWIAGLLALFLLVSCSTGDDAVAAGSDFQFVSPGGKLEIFYDGADRKSIGDLSGESLLEEKQQIKLSDYPGKAIVLNIWGSWCGPCRVEAPELQKLYDQNRDTVVVIGIDVRDMQRSAPQDFVRNNKLTYPSIYDPPGKSLLALKGYPKSVVPSTIVLDRNHRVAAIYLRSVVATDVLPLLNRLASEPA